MTATMTVSIRQHWSFIVLGLTSILTAGYYNFLFLVDPSVRNLANLPLFITMALALFLQLAPKLRTTKPLRELLMLLVMLLLLVHLSLLVFWTTIPAQPIIDEQRWLVSTEFCYQVTLIVFHTVSLVAGIVTMRRTLKK